MEITTSKVLVRMVKIKYIVLSHYTIHGLYDVTYTAFGTCMGDHGANYFRNFKRVAMKLGTRDCHGGYDPDMRLDGA